MTRYTQNGPREIVAARTETLWRRIRRWAVCAFWFSFAAVIVLGVVTILPALLALYR